MASHPGLRAELRYVLSFRSGLPQTLTAAPHGRKAEMTKMVMQIGSERKPEGSEDQEYPLESLQEPDRAKLTRRQLLGISEKALALALARTNLHQRHVLLTLSSAADHAAEYVEEQVDDG